MYTVLAGGVGAARFLEGLQRAVPPASIRVISNTGDDLEIFGLYVSPDTDIVLYTLAGAINPETGWGLAGDSFAVVEALKRFGYPRWFNLGDRDLATAIHRTRLLRQGVPMDEIVAALARDWDVGVRVIPMSNDPVRTVIAGPEGDLPFQEYMVRLRAEVPVQAVHFAGVETARPAPGLLEAIADARIVIIAPSNPFVSIGPILAVPGIREALGATGATRVAISPIIAGEVVKGPAARMLASLGHDVSALGVARLYQPFIDVFVLDTADAALAPQVEALGLRAVITETLMSTPERKLALARAVIAAGGHP